MVISVVVEDSLFAVWVVDNETVEYVLFANNRRTVEVDLLFLGFVKEEEPAVDGFVLYVSQADVFIEGLVVVAVERFVAAAVFNLKGSFSN